jgi:hypothetical protein
MFDCLGFVKDKRPGLKKLDDRSTPMVFIRYSEGAKAYRMLQPSTGHVYVSRDVVFDESRGWSWTSGASNGEPAAQRDFTVKFYTTCARDNDIDANNPPQGDVPPLPVPQADQQTPPPADPVAVEFMTLINGDEEHLDVFYEDLSVRYRHMNQIIDDEPGSWAGGVCSFAGAAWATTAGAGEVAAHHCRWGACLIYRGGSR